MSIHGIDMNKVAEVVGVERARSWRTLWLFPIKRVFYSGYIVRIDTSSNDDRYEVVVTFREQR